METGKDWLGCTCHLLRKIREQSWLGMWGLADCVSSQVEHLSETIVSFADVYPRWKLLFLGPRNLVQKTFVLRPKDNMYLSVEEKQ